MSLVPATRIQTVEMRVPMYSYGCERKIRKALSQFEGLLSVEIDFQQQKVCVTGMLNRDQILCAIKAKRKDAEFWSSCKEDQILSLPDNDSGKLNDPPANGRKKGKKKDEWGTTSEILFEQWETRCESRVWCVDSHGNVCMNREEVKSVTLFPGISFSFKWVHGFLLEVLYEIITCCSRKD